MKYQPILFSLSLVFLILSCGCEDQKSGHSREKRDMFVSDLGRADIAQSDSGVALVEKDMPSDQQDMLDIEEIVFNQNAIFVSTAGMDSNDGRTVETPFRTMTKAAAIAIAGETIYVEAGTYENEIVVFENNGEEDSPITLEGYQRTPGDRPTYKNFDEKTLLDPTLMPLLDGGDRSQGIGITMFGSFLITRNLAIRNVARGIYGYGAQHSEVHRVYISTLGENNEEAYSGKGIIFGSDASYNLIKDSVVIDAGAEGIAALGQNNRIDNCTVISTSKEENDNSTDYYLFVDGSDNIIEHSRAIRIGEQEHVGHGIGLKGDCENNILRNNLADGFAGASFYARHRGVRNNLYKNNRAVNGEMGMNFRDGASGNIVEGFTTQNMDWPIIFLDSDEDGGKTFSGKDNIVRDCHFKNTRKAIVAFHDYLYDDIFAESNLIENCVIEDSPYLFDVRSKGKNNIFKDSILKNVSEYATFKSGKVESDIGFTFENIIQENNGFVLP